MNFTIFDFTYIESIFVLVLTLYMFKLLFRKKYIMNVKNAAPSKRAFVKKHLLKFEIVIRSILLIGISVFLFGRIIPGIIDLKYYISKDYPYMSAKVLEDSLVGNSKNNAQHLLVVKDINTNKKWNLTVSFPYDLHKGDEIEITYLPHLKFGEIDYIHND